MRQKHCVAGQFLISEEPWEVGIPAPRGLPQQARPARDTSVFTAGSVFPETAACKNPADRFSPASV